jgi:uncharacterized membrane protein
MASHENSIVIEAPASEVFAYVNEPRTLPDWMVGMIEVRNVIGAGEGLQYDWTFKMVGIQLRGQNVVVEYIPNERASHQGIGMISSLWTNIVEPDPGGTRLTIEVEYTIPVPVLGKLAESLTVRRNERGVQLSLLNIKDTLEADQEPAAP